MYEEQVAWAKEAGVDFIVAETINWTEEMKIALKDRLPRGVVTSNDQLILKHKIIVVFSIVQHARVCDT